MASATWILILWTCLQSEAAAIPQAGPAQEREAPAAKKPGQEPENGRKQSFGTDMSFYPIPAVYTSKNEGTTYGLLGAFLFPNEDGEITQLFSIDLGYRSIVGVNGFIDYRNYLDAESLFVASAYEAARVENDHLLLLDRRRFLNDYSLHAEFEENRIATDRFFGESRRSTLSEESVFASSRYQGLARFGVYLIDGLRIEGTARVRKYRVGRSPVKGIQQTLDAFPQELGISGGWVTAEGARFVYDTRDGIYTPTQGEYGSIAFEAGHYFTEGVGRPFQAVSLEAEELLPFGEEALFVLVMHVKAQVVTGEAPFWEMAALGGATTLRGFGGNRFTDDATVVVNLEGRLRMMTLEIEGVTGEVQIAPFLDLGEVYDLPENIFRQNFREGFHYSYGAGLRGVVKPNVVGRMDIGYGSDGLAISVGLDYPF